MSQRDGLIPYTLCFDWSRRTDELRVCARNRKPAGAKSGGFLLYRLRDWKVRGLAGR